MIRLATCPDWCTADHTDDLDERFRFVDPDVLHYGPVDTSPGGYTLTQCRTDLHDQPGHVTDYDLEDDQRGQISLPPDPDILDQLAAMLTRTATRLRTEQRLG